jgi:hypothetical protein
MHRALGGTAWTPAHEESARVYHIEALPESKTGGQVPKSWAKFLETDWFRRALSQSERAIPAGTNCKPAVVIDGKWMVVRIG